MSSGADADAAAPDEDGRDATAITTQSFADTALGSGAHPSDSTRPQHHPRLSPDDAATRPYVTVSDPIQHTEGLKGKFTMYRVACDPPPPADAGAAAAAPFPYATAVNRRYSDFAWLCERLHRERPGAIVPPLPEKQPWREASRLSDDFVEERRRCLEVFLRRAVGSPELAETECLLMFLGGGEAEFKKAKKDMSFGKAAGAAPNSPARGSAGSRVDAGINQTRDDDYANDGIEMNGANPTDLHDTLVEKSKERLAGSKNGIKKWIKEKKTTIKGTMVRSPDDAIFEEVTNFVLALEAGLKRVEAQAAAMVQREQNTAASLLELSLGCDALAHLDDYGRDAVADGAGAGDESGASGLGETFRMIGRTADAVSVTGADHSRREMAGFAAPLRDHLKMVHAVKVALSKRNNRRITYSTCLNAVDAKKSSWHRTRLTPGQEGKALGLESSLSRAEVAVTAARANYDEVSARVLREVDRFRRDNARAMYATMLEFARAQKEHAEQVSAAWGALLPAVERVDATRCTGSSFAQMAAALKDGGDRKAGVAAERGGEAAGAATAQGGNAPMPSEPPPPEPSANAVCDANAESPVLAGTVRYRDPMPEE